MRDTSRHLAERLKFLRLPLLPFQEFLIGQVNDQSESTRVLANFIE
jgi:hypothetical protein